MGVGMCVHAYVRDARAPLYGCVYMLIWVRQNPGVSSSLCEEKKAWERYVLVRLVEGGGGFSLKPHIEVRFK